MQLDLGLATHLTHKANAKQTRYGWLRLTPAHSLHLVRELLGDCGTNDIVLDPFCGTGTTALVCAERGILAETTDINPFLQWLATTKTRSYKPEEIEQFIHSARQAADFVSIDPQMYWTPPLHQIEKWWDEPTLKSLSQIAHFIQDGMNSRPEASTNLLKIAFCRLLIEQANVSFNHQSMSFKKQKAELVSDTLDKWQRACSDIACSAQTPILREPEAFLCDARQLTAAFPKNRFDCVITSPPYPNRMSYIRELRPYMYWLGYLSDGRAAGELDWQAIGGTWGCATSNVAKWQPDDKNKVPFLGFTAILAAIHETSPVLSRYVHKYFYDMVIHCEELFSVVKPGGQIHYIVGNSKFYEVLLPVEQIFAALFQSVDFTDVSVRTIRKRTSKKELFEFVVSAKKAASCT